MKGFLGFIVLALTPIVGYGQGTSFGAGVQGSYSTNTTDNVFPSVYADLKVGLPANLQYRLHGEISKDEYLSTIFTRDNHPTRKASGEVRLTPELRFWFNRGGSTFKPFVGGGVDYFRQFGLEKPYQGLNPLLTFGTRIGYGYEVSFTRIFTDPTDWNRSDLSGYRADFAYDKKLAGKLHLVLGAGVDWLRFREDAGVGYDYYFERDLVPKVRVGFEIR